MLVVENGPKHVILVTVKKAEHWYLTSASLILLTVRPWRVYILRLKQRWNNANCLAFKTGKMKLTDFANAFGIWMTDCVRCGAKSLKVECWNFANRSNFNGPISNSQISHMRSEWEWFILFYNIWAK